MDTNLSKYVNHLPTCNIMQDWSEAETAMADTPEKFRDYEWEESRKELYVKMKTCTCGLSELLQALAGQGGVVPTDEEINKQSIEADFMPMTFKNGFIRGAKWMRDKLQPQGAWEKLDGPDFCKCEVWQGLKNLSGNCFYCNKPINYKQS